MRKLALAAVIALLWHHASAQQVYLSDWQTISSLYQIQAVDADADGTIWTATSGGVPRWTTGSEPAFTKYDNINGLKTLDCTSIFCDTKSGLTYVGQRDGSLDIYSKRSDSWSSIGDIQRSTQYPKRAVSGFSQRGDTLAIATEFGFVLLNSATQLFIETVDRVGQFPEKSAVRSIRFIDNNVWVVINGNVATAPLNVTTLRLPSVWTVITASQGLPDSTEPVLFMASKGSRLCVATARRVFERTSDGQFKLAQTVDRDINGLSIGTDGSLIVSTPVAVFVGEQDLKLDRSFPSPITGHTVIQTSRGQAVVAFLQSDGLGIIQDGTLKLYGFNSPLSNQFTDISIDTKGWIWAATHTDGGYGGQGVSYFDGTSWRSITTASEPALQSNGCYRVSSLADGTTWIGTWGRGAVKCEHTESGLRLTSLNARNSSLAGIPADSNYVLVSEAALDKFGRTILLNEQSTDRLFAVADGSGGWAFRQNCANPRENVYRSLAVDGNGTVWCGSPESRGLIGYNDKNTPSQDDDICNKIMSSNSQLQDNVVTSLATDQNGALWIGTAKGLSVVSSPWNLTNTTIPFVRRVSVMSSTYINDVFVDALNYKWIATNNGVFVLDESGIEVLATITTATSPLLDNNVRSIAIDDATGLAYFGTLKGCSVAKTSSMRPLPSFDVSCYPQPFRAGSQTQLVIDGLAPDSEVRIMTSGGILVSAIAARGRQALWDGRDVYGNMVPPGIYVASVSSASTSSSSVLKIAVTR
jgi:ligand-binding sensor domain-containing protein